MGIAPGLVCERHFEVTDDLSTDVAGSLGTRVLATPRMIAVMENTSMRAVWEHLPEGATCVGYAVNIKHVSSAPLGAQCLCRALLTEVVAGRKLHFDVSVTYEGRIVGLGTHERRIIDSAKLDKRNGG